MNESTVREATMPSFSCGKHDVTRGQYVRMSGRADPSHWNPETSGGRLKAGDLPRLPVERVDWFASDEAARRAGFALPSEARWEYACRAGSDEVFFFGDDPGGLPDHANLQDRQWAAAFNDQAGAGDFADGHAVVAPVGSFQPNAFGLHGVHGNIVKWFADWHDRGTYSRPREECADPTGAPSGNARVLAAAPGVSRRGTVARRPATPTPRRARAATSGSAFPGLLILDSFLFSLFLLRERMSDVLAP